MSKVFISYRREGGEYLAGRIYDNLSARGISAFYDVESLEAGKFNEQLYDRIVECRHFVIILPPDALNRCSDPADWVRLEIAKALEFNKNIIPIMMLGFEFPEDLPDDIKEIVNYQGISMNNAMFKEQMAKLLVMIDENPGEKITVVRDPGNRGLLKIIMVLMIILAFVCGGVLFGFHTLTRRNSPEKTEEPSKKTEESVKPVEPAEEDESEETDEAEEEEEEPEETEKPQKTDAPEKTGKPVPTLVIPNKPTVKPSSKPNGKVPGTMPPMKKIQ